MPFWCTRSARILRGQAFTTFTEYGISASCTALLCLIPYAAWYLYIQTECIQQIRLLSSTLHMLAYTLRRVAHLLPIFGIQYILLVFLLFSFLPYYTADRSPVLGYNYIGKMHFKQTDLYINLYVSKWNDTFDPPILH